MELPGLVYRGSTWEMTSKSTPSAGLIISSLVLTLSQTDLGSGLIRVLSQLLKFNYLPCVMRRLTYPYTEVLVREKPLMCTRAVVGIS